MPRNLDGTYDLPLPDVAPDTTIASTWANTTLHDIATALEDSLSRSGKGGMGVALPNPDGTEAVPGISFSDDTDTGFFRDTANEIGVSTGGDEVARFTEIGVEVAGTIDTTGNASVGGTLDVTGAATFDAAVTAGGLITGEGLDASSNVVSNVSDPVADTDAATKGWVEANSGVTTAWTQPTAGHANVNTSNLRWRKVNGWVQFSGTITFTGDVSHLGDYLLVTGPPPKSAASDATYTLQQYGANLDSGILQQVQLIFAPNGAELRCYSDQNDFNINSVLYMDSFTYFAGV